MSSSKKDEIQIITPAASVVVPDFLQEEYGSNEGMENVDQSDILIPRLGLCQALSPQKRKSDPAYIPGLEEGQLFNTVTGEIYGDKLTVVLLYFFKNRIKYIPRDEGGGIDCSSPNAIDGGRISHSCSSCQFSQWGNGKTSDEEGNDAPLCTLYHNYMSFTKDTPLAISYKSTGIKDSKALLSNVRITRLPMYAKLYEITVVTRTADKNEWYEKKITPGKFVEADVFAQMKEMFNNLQNQKIHVDTTGENEERDANTPF